MHKATDLNFSLFNVVLSREVHFSNLTCIMDLPYSPPLYFSSFADNARCQFAVVLYNSAVAVVVAIKHITHIFCSDCRDTFRTVHYLYCCLMGRT